MNSDIRGFFGEYRFLSNFWPAPFELDGYLFATSEHAYQAYKTLDVKEFDTVRLASTAGKAKRLGKTITVRPDWDTFKLTVMERVIYEKFSQNKDLKQMLLDTGDAHLEETNTWGDTYWGVCNGVGKNHLGDILMDTRTILRMEQFFT